MPSPAHPTSSQCYLFAFFLPSYLLPLDSPDTSSISSLSVSRGLVSFPYFYFLLYCHFLPYFCAIYTLLFSSSRGSCQRIYIKYLHCLHPQPQLVVTLTTAKSSCSRSRERLSPSPVCPLYISSQLKDPDPKPGTSAKLTESVPAAPTAERPITTPSLSAPAQYG